LGHWPLASSNDLNFIGGLSDEWANFDDTSVVVKNSFPRGANRCGC
jgi:hypothetical protein